ncbi:MAG: PqqD family protein [Nitrospinota bacterium]|nr:PqqD family protein [Nitrospinota bacterium]
MKYQAPEDITWKNLKTGIVLLNLSSGEYYTLNDTAAEIWRHAIEGEEKEAIIGYMTETYKDVSADDLAQHVDESMDYFLTEKLLAPTEGQ